MAMTATISLNISTALINEPVQQNLTISNSGSSAVLVTSVLPQVVLTGASQPFAFAGSVGQYAIGTGQNVTVPASGSLVLSAPVVFFAPSTGPYGAGSNTYSCGAIITTNDGSIFSPTAATVTVNPIALPSTEQ